MTFGHSAHSAHNALEPDGVWIFPKLCKTCLEFNKHKAAADSTKSEYEKDKQINRFCSPGTLYLSADMQVVMMPRMPGYKTAIFTKRMVCFHETFAPIGTFTDRKLVGVVWNESITGRNATDVAATFVRFIREEKSTQVSYSFLSG